MRDRTGRSLEKIAAVSVNVAESAVTSLGDSEKHHAANCHG